MDREKPELLKDLDLNRFEIIEFGTRVKIIENEILGEVDYSGIVRLPEVMVSKHLTDKEYQQIKPFITNIDDPRKKNREENKMAKMGAKGIKNGEEVKKVETIELECFGGFMEEDPFCVQCEEVVSCKKRAMELMKEISEESGEDEDSDRGDLQEPEEEVQDEIEESSDQDDLQKIEEENQDEVAEDFDPRSLNLTSEDRIDILFELNIDQLIQVSEYLGIEISHIDQEKEDASDEIIMEIDTFLEKSEGEVEEHEPEVRSEEIESQEAEEHEPEVQPEEIKSQEEDTLDEEEKFTSTVLGPKEDINSIDALCEKKFLEYDSKISTLENLLKQTVKEIEERDLKIAELGVQLGHVGKQFDQLGKEEKDLDDRVESLSDFYMKSFQGLESQLEKIMDRIATCEKGLQTSEVEKEMTILTPSEMLGIIKVSRDNLNDVINTLSQTQEVSEPESKEVIEKVAEGAETKVEDPIIEEQKIDEIVEGQQKSEDSEPVKIDGVPQFFAESFKKYQKEVEIKEYKDRVSAKIKGKKIVLAGIIKGKTLVLYHAKEDYGMIEKFYGKPSIDIGDPKAPEILAQYIDDLPR